MVRRRASEPATTASRSFVYRGGIRIAGTVIACDAQGGADLLFVSSGRAYVTERRAARGSQPGPRAQVLVTAETLALLGARGEALRPRALIVSPGRPFQLGATRVELLATGVLPGAAALLAEAGGKRLLYAGTMGRAALDGRAPRSIRAADALCVDATFGDPRFAFCSAEAALEDAKRFAREAHDAGAAPVLLASPLGPVHELARGLAEDGWRLRGHRSMVEAAVAYARAGVDVPSPSRFSGRLARGELLLWPAAVQLTAGLRALGPTRTLWVSGWASDRRAVATLRPDVAVPYGEELDHAALTAFVGATGAREVALLHEHDGTLGALLRDRGLVAYQLSPPHQIPLFG